MSDIVAYRCGFVSEGDSEGIALARVNEMIEIILADTKATEYQVWLSDSHENNFRTFIDPSYKANRTAPKPIHLEAIKDYLFTEWNASQALGEEADDALGILQDKGTIERWEGGDIYLDSVICSIDKDLLQIPGNHYNFVRKEKYFISPLEGFRNFYKQMLIGDTSDNVKGVEGIGKVKAAKFLDPLQTEFQMFHMVRRLYDDDVRLLRNGRLLYIRKQEDEIWNWPQEIIEQEVAPMPKLPTSQEKVPVQ